MGGGDNYTNAAARLADIQVLRAADNSMVRLGDIMQRGPVLICFFRRWGCALCKMSAVNLSVIKPYLDEKGVQLVGIGGDKATFTAGWKEGNYFDGELFIDEAKAAYAALNLQKNSWTNLWGLNTGIVRDFRTVQGKGYENDFEGDFDQFGGTLLFDAAGTCLYAHKQTSASFNPDYSRMLEKLGITVDKDKLGLDMDYEAFRKLKTDGKRKVCVTEECL